MLTRADGWVWFVEISRKGGGKYRLCDNAVHLAANGLKWVACGMDFQTPEESSDGQIGEFILSVPNVSRAASGAFERDLIIDQRVTVWAEHEADFASFREALVWRLVARKAVVNEAKADITCGHPLGIERLPPRVFDASVAPVFAATPGGSVP